MQIRMTQKLKLLGILVLFLSMQGVGAEESFGAHKTKHSIEFSPLSPLFHIYAVQYGYEFTDRDEMVLGLAYMNIQYDFGETNAPAFILGYRRSLWRKLHLEYQLWPTYDNFYEKNEGKYYQSYDLWNEFRLGYRFNFTLRGVPFYVTPQWPFGFGLYASNKPESFIATEKENPFFYHAPIIYFGWRF